MIGLGSDKNTWSLFLEKEKSSCPFYNHFNFMLQMLLDNIPPPSPNHLKWSTQMTYMRSIWRSSGRGQSLEAITCQPFFGCWWVSSGRTRADFSRKESLEWQARTPKFGSWKCTWARATTRTFSASMIRTSLPTTSRDSSCNLKSQSFLKHSMKWLLNLMRFRMSKRTSESKKLSQIQICPSLIKEHSSS